MTKHLGRYASVLIPAVMAVIGLLLGLGSGALAQKTYTATNAVLVGGNSQAQSSGQVNDTEALIRTQMQNFEYLVTSPLVLEPALKAAGLPGTAESMPASVSGSATLNTSILEITVTANDPEKAATLANATQDSLIAAVEKYGPKAANGKPVLVAHQVSKSTPPATPSSPNLLLNALTGAFLGLALGLAVSKLVARLGDGKAASAESAGARRFEGR